MFYTHQWDTIIHVVVIVTVIHIYDQNRFLQDV